MRREDDPVDCTYLDAPWDVVDAYLFPAGRVLLAGSSRLLFVDMEKSSCAISGPPHAFHLARSKLQQI